MQSQSLSRNVENQPTSITGPDNVTETYLYNADGTRVARTRAGLTTVYAGPWEEDFQSGSSKETRAFMSIQGRTIAQRARTTAPATDTTIYLHGDHLGSVSVATSSTGAVLSKQGFTPWGEVRPHGFIAQTTLNYTGQKLDGTGLLFYHARYYDPKLGRFASADSVELQGAVPQTLNRYAYVRNNPLRYTDPSGREEQPLGGSAPQYQQCAESLNCSVETVNSLSWDERIAFLHMMDDLYQLAGWFNTVIGIIEYFRDSPTFQNSDRIKFEDAWVITVIQDGLRGALGRSGGALSEAGQRWQDFFQEQQRGKPYEQIVSLWGTAEQQGVNEAGRESQGRGYSFTKQQQAVYNTFLVMGNYYRSSATNNSPMYVAPGVPEMDPNSYGKVADPRTDRDFVRWWAAVTEAAVNAGCALPWACDEP